MTTAHCLDNMSGFEFKQMHKSMILKEKLTLGKINFDMYEYVLSYVIPNCQILDSDLYIKDFSCFGIRKVSLDKGNQFDFFSVCIARSCPPFRHLSFNYTYRTPHNLNLVQNLDFEHRQTPTTTLV